MKFNLTNSHSSLRIRLLSINKKTFIFLLCTTVFGFTPKNAFSQEKVTIANDSWKQKNLEIPASAISEVYPEGQAFNSYTQFKLRTSVPRTYLNRRSLLKRN